jgi:dipeptidyl aminopeptidase/acylaminoacyl peptidase
MARKNVTAENGFAYALRSLTLLVGITLLLRPMYSQELVPIPIKEILDTKRFPASTGIRLSPDRRWVAYTLVGHRQPEVPVLDAGDSSLHRSTAVPRALVGSSVYLTDLGTGKSKNLTQGWSGSSWEPVWSPDGRKLAFYSDRSGEVGLWVWDSDTSSSKRVSDLTIRFEDPFEPAQWTPDSTKLLAVTESSNSFNQTQPATVISEVKLKSLEQSDPEPTIVVYGGEAKQPLTSSPGEVHSQGWSKYLVIFNLKSGDVDRLAAGFQPMWFRLSRDGTRVAFTSRVEPNSEVTLESLADLVVIDLPGGSPRIVARSIRTFDGVSFSWSPDNRLLVYASSYFKKDGGLSGECFLVAASGGEPRRLTSSSHPDFISDSGAVPVWDERGLNIYLLALSSQPGLYQSLWRLSVDGRITTEVARLPQAYFTSVVASSGMGRFWSPDHGLSMIVMARDRNAFRDGFYSVDLVTGAATKLFEEDKSYAIDAPSLDVSADNQCAVFKAEDVTHPQDIWMLCVSDLRKPMRITSVNPEFDRHTMGRSMLIDWTSLDGEILHGALLLPAGYQTGKRYPLIVCVYPGQYRSLFLNVFGMADMYTDNMQIFATRGAAVLYPDAPTKVGTEMADILKTIIPGVDKVIQLGIADPDRLGIMGHSWGGYAVLSLIVQTNRFKAALSRSGVGGNLIRFYTVMFQDGSSPGISETEALKTGGSLWEKRSVFIENSPIFFLDRLRTPILLTHGTADQVSSGFSDEVFVCLTRLGKEVQYVKYQNEDHYEANWSYAHQLDFLDRVVNWFGQHLQMGNN